MIVGIKMDYDLFFIMQYTERVKWMNGFNPALDGSGQHGHDCLLVNQVHRRRRHGGLAGYNIIATVAPRRQRVEVFVLYQKFTILKVEPP